MSHTRSRLRSIPSTDRLLTSQRGECLLDRFPRELVVEAFQLQTDELRQSILGGQPSPTEEQQERWLLERAEAHLQSLRRGRLRRVINATGVVLHTNLGRAPLSEAALGQVAEVSRSYSNLELDLATGRRGSRYSNVVDLVKRLTGAEACLVVNNCAAAMMLIVSTFATGREVVVSRGELVEIGGSYRLPDVLTSAGARLVEVGTTNKTRLADYEKVAGQDTAMFLASHLSNFRIIGFTERPSREELAELGHRLGVVTCLDLGSGLIDSLGIPALAEEPTVAQMVGAGFDVVAFSGDKLLGGPQAGIVVGRKGPLELLRKSPMNRALRVGKLTLAALEATLALHLAPQWAKQELPLVRMLSMGLPELQARAQVLCERLKAVLGELAAVDVCSGSSSVGGGSLPGQELPTQLVAVRPHRDKEERWASRLRRHSPAVLVRRGDGALYLDPRTLAEEEIPELEESFRRLSE